MKDLGKKFNKGKIRYELLPTYGIEEAAKVFGFGAKKYGEYNWKKGLKYTALLGSLERHLVDIKRGIDIDKESGLTSIGHLLCNAMMLAEFICVEKYEDLDDRFT